MSTILVVNDDPGLVELYHLLLERQGCNVIGVYTSYEGLDVINDTKPDLIITNIARSEMDGWEFVIACKTNPLTRDIPVIIASAQSYRPEMQQKYGNYIEDYLYLPFIPGDLTDSVKKVLEKHAIRR